MRAIGLNQYGGPEVLHPVDMPDPTPAEGEVRVRVRAAGINPVDVMVRQGDLAALFADITPPYVPGMDIAGVVDTVGPRVDPELVGKAVTGLVDNHGGYGGYSDYVCLPADSVIAVPAGAEFPEAASFLMNAMTAQNALDTLNLPAGSSVLVTGAAGAVGGYTVALGNDAGLRVLALASGGDEDLVRSLGATDFIRRGTDVEASVRKLIPEGVDAVVDAASLYEQVVPAIRDEGTLIVLRPREDETLQRGVRTVFVNVRERATDQDALKRLGEKVESGVLPLRVAGVFPADQASMAHERLDAGGVRGRLVLDFS